MNKRTINYYNQLITLIDKARLISFDFFGTLFLKPLNREEDFFILLGEQLGLKGFPEQRRAAHREALKQARSAGRTEVTLKDIYTCYWHESHDTDHLMRAEYELQLQLAKPNEELLTLIREIVDAQKQVVITEDSHLSRRIF